MEETKHDIRVQYVYLYTHMMIHQWLHTWWIGLVIIIIIIATQLISAVSRTYMILMLFAFDWNEEIEDMMLAKKN